MSSTWVLPWHPWTSNPHRGGHLILERPFEAQNPAVLVYVATELAADSCPLQRCRAGNQSLRVGRRAALPKHDFGNKGIATASQQDRLGSL